MQAPPPARSPAAAPAPAAPTTQGQVFLKSVQDTLGTRWLKATSDTALRAGPSDTAQAFTTVPQWTTLRQVDTRPDWVEVYYSGDGATRQPGPGWVKATDAGAIGTPPVWLSSQATLSLWPSATDASHALMTVPSGESLEVVATDPIEHNRLQVQLPGDGRGLLPAAGWVDPASLQLVTSNATVQVPWAFPDDLQSAVHLAMPYRTQFDGSDFSEANCGPTALGMALGHFNVNATPETLRSEVLSAQGDDPRDDEEGSYVWALAQAAQSNGASALGLYDADGSMHAWTVDDVRTQLLSGHPVILQVRYKYLPHRADAAYQGDHFVVITGILGDQFLYDDPVGGASDGDGPGWDREMTASQLDHAMNASDTRFAHTGFGLSA